MLEPIIGSLVREQVLLFMHARGKGYAREIARFFNASLDSVQKQLKRLAEDYVLVSEKVGRTVVYRFDPEYPFLAEVRSLMERLIKERGDEHGSLTEGVRPGRYHPGCGGRVIVRDRSRGH
ncbi:MAG: winged helix-turn-helix transcriptional regulator [Candidatus Fermentibacteraceae bacterium]|nr:winged helix-turn-helix transcriptional regulator [Candidatus Fermentibacteraceae bacterium]MBN2607920.1 winged helix-turn-helix transcriptional regulator [Candidatus Fermentibacteraceae bacterium]